MRSKISPVICLLIIVAFNSTIGLCCDSKDLVLVTNEFPPYAFLKDEEFSGIAVDIVKNLSSLSGCSYEIIMLPWKRALQYSKNQKILLFPYTRQPYREKQFKWIGPIMTDTFVFAVNSKEKRIFNTIEDFRDLEIGVVHSTPTAYRLKKLGFKKLQFVNQEKQNAHKIVSANRIEAWYTPELILTHTLKLEGINFKKEVKIAFIDSDVYMYIAASLSVPDEIVNLWQKNIDYMKESGQYQQILKNNGFERANP